MPFIEQIHQLMILAQEGDSDAAAAPAANMSGMILLMGSIAVLYIFLMVLPQRKEQKVHQQMIDSLKKNDRVVFGGGIRGTVLNVHADGDITVRIDETSNTKMRILRGAISKSGERRGGGKRNESGVQEGLAVL